MYLHKKNFYGRMKEKTCSWITVDSILRAVSICKTVRRYKYSNMGEIKGTILVSLKMPKIKYKTGRVAKKLLKVSHEKLF